MKKIFVLFISVFFSATAFAMAAVDTNCMWECGYAGGTKKACDKICVTR